MASLSSSTSASVVVPTRARPRYLEVALASIAPQARSTAAEVIVVDDAGPSTQVRELCERYGARYEPHDRPLGLNVARNTGVERSKGDLVVFVDDDVEVSERWLEALLAATRKHPDVDVFTGPILPRLEGSPPRTCGREGPPITSLYLGARDAFTAYAWGANMTIRRSALERVGPFDVELAHGGDEQEWQERLARQAVSPPSPTGADTHAAIVSERAPTEPVLYVADAALHHRRDPHDARLRPLCRAAFARGKAARRFDEWRGKEPSSRAELTTLARCLGHVVRRRCPAALVMVAHSGGRTLQALRGAPPTRPRELRLPANQGTANGAQPSDDFLSGESGTVGGLDGFLRTVRDLAGDGLEIASGRRRRLDRAARHLPAKRRVLVLGVERPEHRELVHGIHTELARSRHDVETCFAPPEDRGKFQNLNILLESHSLGDRDWLLVLDDDITLPANFLDRLLFLAEHFGFDLAQPAHRLASHAAWKVTRRRRGSLARETRFVEIGPVTVFARSTFSTLLPFPDLRMGWGLDVHWAALARESGWRCGVIDAVAIGHRGAPAASAYSREQALAEARSFLAGRPYLSAGEAQRTLTTYRHL
jgi:hypothetical protein